MENEIMNAVEEAIETNDDIVTTTGSFGLGKAALVVTGLAAVGFAAFKLGKKALAVYKSKKEKSKDDVVVINNLNDNKDVNK